MIIERLDPVDPEPGEDLWGAEDHPMRLVTRRIARDGRWDDEDRRVVAGLFDTLAEDWDATRSAPERLAVIDDVFDRGPIPVDVRRCLELGAGTGLFTPRIARYVGHVVAADLARGMVSRIPRSAGSPLQTDGSRLPFADAVFDVAVLVNMFLFPAELARVLEPGGAIVWISSRGARTPIHLTAEEVAEALPGDWNAVTSRFTTSTWAVLRRAGRSPVSS